MLTHSLTHSLSSRPSHSLCHRSIAVPVRRTGARYERWQQREVTAAEIDGGVDGAMSRKDERTTRESEELRARLSQRRIAGEGHIDQREEGM